MVRGFSGDGSVKYRFSREVVSYEVEGLPGELAQRPQVISEHATGLDLFIDLDAID